MSYLLQNRRRFYETVLPRIPDQKVRKAFEEINRLSEIDVAFKEDVNKPSTSLLSINLEDVFKKPTIGERLGNVVISVEELIDQALHLEQLCHEAYAQDDSDLGRQIYDSLVFRIERLRKLRDSLEYHRFRLID